MADETPMSDPTSEEIAAGLDANERALILSLSGEPSRIGTRASWTERKAVADALPNGLILRSWAADCRRYSLSATGLAVKSLIEKESRRG